MLDEMIRQFDPRAVVDVVDEVLATDPADDLEPAATATRLENNDPHTITIQRTRLEYAKDSSEVTGELLIDVRIPYDQLPVTQIIPEDKGVTSMDVDLPPGTTEEVIRDADEPTQLPDLGFEHDSFNEQLMGLCRDIPAVNAEESDEELRCLVFDNDTAVFSAVVELEDEVFDPTSPVPVDLRIPREKNIL